MFCIFNLRYGFKFFFLRIFDDTWNTLRIFQRFLQTYISLFEAFEILKKQPVSLILITNSWYLMTSVMSIYINEWEPFFDDSIRKKLRNNINFSLPPRINTAKIFLMYWNFLLAYTNSFCWWHNRKTLLIICCWLSNYYKTSGSYRIWLIEKISNRKSLFRWWQVWSSNSATKFYFHQNHQIKKMQKQQAI